VMDQVLLRRASDVGATVIESAGAVEPRIENGSVRGVRVKLDGLEQEFSAHLTIDATGRARILARRVSAASRATKKAKLIAFKAHLRNTRVAPGACEIYFYTGGYGGLSTIEGGASNFCFITSAEQVKQWHSDA